MTFFLLLVFFSCSTEKTIQSQAKPSPKLSGAFTHCRQYHGYEVFGYCMYQRSEHLITLRDVNYYCSMAAEWEEACRQTWASKMSRMQSKPYLSLETLIEGCAGFSDCTFEVLDARPSKDVQVQLQRCGKYVVNDYEDCASHAMQRWLNSNPTQEEGKQLLEKVTYLPNSVLKFVAILEYCKGFQICEGKLNNQIKCREQHKRLRKTPELCRTNWGDMGAKGRIPPRK